MWAELTSLAFPKCQLSFLVPWTTWLNIYCSFIILSSLYTFYIVHPSELPNYSTFATTYLSSLFTMPAPYSYSQANHLSSLLYSLPTYLPQLTCITDHLSTLHNFYSCYLLFLIHSLNTISLLHTLLHLPTHSSCSPIPNLLTLCLKSSPWHLNITIFEISSSTPTKIWVAMQHLYSKKLILYWNSSHFSYLSHSIKLPVTLSNVDLLNQRDHSNGGCITISLVPWKEKLYTL